MEVVLTDTTDEQYNAARLAWSKIYDLRSCIERAVTYAVFLRVRGHQNAIVVCERVEPETWADDARLSSLTTTKALRDLELRGVLQHVHVEAGAPLPHGGVAERDEDLTFVIPSENYKPEMPDTNFGTMLAFSWQPRFDMTPEERALVAMVQDNHGPMPANVIAETLSVGLPLAMMLRDRIPRLLDMYLAESKAGGTPPPPETPASRAAFAALTGYGRRWTNGTLKYRKGKDSLPAPWRVAHTSSLLSVYAYEDLLAVAFDHHFEKSPERWRQVLVFSAEALPLAKVVEAGQVFIGAGKRVEFAGALFDIEEIAGQKCVYLGHRYDDADFQGHFALDINSALAFFNDAGLRLTSKHMVS